MHDHFRRCATAYQEQDRCYAAQDPQLASIRIEEIKQLAIDHFKNGVAFAKDSSYIKPTILQKYLSKEMITELKENIMIINKSSYEQPEGLFAGHTYTFQKELSEAIHRLKEDAERERLAALDQWHRELLETDPVFRKIVSHILQVRPAGSRNWEYELMYRLFGYQKSLDGLREVYKKLKELLQPYQTPVYQVYRLRELGKAYVNNGELLPAVQAVYYREEGQFYYGDRVVVSGKIKMVDAVGRIYLTLEGGYKCRRTEAVLYNPNKKLEDIRKGA